jgi:hypothetical protein
MTLIKNSIKTSSPIEQIEFKKPENPTSSLITEAQKSPFSSVWSLPGTTETGNNAERLSTTTIAPKTQLDIDPIVNSQKSFYAWEQSIQESKYKLASYRDDLNTTQQNQSSNTLNSSDLFNSGFTGSDQGFSGIPNDGKSDPLYDASKHTKEENQKISDMMTIVNSSSSSEVSNADSLNGEYFTAAFSQGIKEGKSLQDVIKGLDGANLRGAQTSQAYNTEKMSSEPISASNKANGTAIILRGSNDGVGEMMAKDEANLKEAYNKLGFNVQVVHSEKEFEKALLDARQKAIEDKAQGKESVLATHVISHGLQAGGTKGADANSALAMKGGGLYHEKDIIGDIAGALEPTEDGESPFKHSYNAFTACHSGGFDNEQTLVAASKPKEEQPTS